MLKTENMKTLKLKKTQRLGIRLDLDTLTKLQYLAGCRNTSAFIRQLVQNEYLKITGSNN
jgi:hypothetical protein